MSILRVSSPPSPPPPSPLPPVPGCRLVISGWRRLGESSPAYRRLSLIELVGAGRSCSELLGAAGGSRLVVVGVGSQLTGRVPSANTCVGERADWEDPGAEGKA